MSAVGRSREFFGHKPQRRVLVAAVATASMLLAVGAPVASANPGTGDGSAGPNHHTHTGGAVTPTGKLTSAVTPPRGAIASSGSSTPTVHLPTAAVAASPTPTVHPPKAAAATPASPPDPGINFGSLGTGNTNSTQNFNALSVNLFGIGNTNTGVANNFGPGSNLTFLGDNNKGTGVNNLEGLVNLGLNTVFGGAGNAAAGVNTITSTIGFGANFAVLGNGNLESGNNSVLFAPLSSGLFGANLALVGSNTTSSGNNTVNGLFGTNFAVVGDGSKFSGDNDGVLNLALLGANSTNSGNNTGGGINIAILPTAAAPGNCTKALCVNLFGLQLL